LKVKEKLVLNCHVEAGKASRGQLPGRGRLGGGWGRLD